MGSWSSLANMSTPTSGQAKKKNAAMESFEQFKKAAKEKEERVGYLCALLIIPFNCVKIANVLITRNSTTSP